MWITLAQSGSMDGPWLFACQGELFVKVIWSEKEA